MSAQPSTTDRKLRVALFSGNYNYVMDGPVRALNMLVGFLERTGHEVLVFAPTTKTPAFKHAGTLVPVPSIPIPGKRSEYRLGLGLNGSLKKKLQDFKPDLIHLAAPDYTGYGALRFARKNNIPAVASFHTRFDTYPRYYGARWLEKYVTKYMRHFYSRVEHVYTPSVSMTEELRADGIGRDVRQWTRGVDGDLFNPSQRDMAWRRANGFADSDIVVAFVGRLVLEKGIDKFVDAFNRAHQSTPTLKALVVGDGPERTAFEQLLPNGYFAGYQHGEGLARAYASADMFFNPSVTETFGNVTLEAMASGLPSVGATATGSRSLIEDGVTGFVAPADAASFAEKIAHLASDDELRRRMGAAARQHSERYRWDAVLAELVGHYQEAVIDYKSRVIKNGASAASARKRAA